MHTHEEESIIWHQSGVNKRGEPFVQLLLGMKIIGQMSTTQARDHARAVTEAAEAAEQDAFMMQWLQDKVNLPFEKAGEVLIGFREYRSKLTGKSQGPTKSSDFIKPEGA